MKEAGLYLSDSKARLRTTQMTDLYSCTK